jgi:hypothetical protein
VEQSARPFEQNCGSVLSCRIPGRPWTNSGKRQDDGGTYGSTFESRNPLRSNLPPFFCLPQQANLSSFLLLLDARRDLCRDRYMLFNFILFCFVFSFSFADVVCEKKLTFGVTLIFLAFYKAVFFFLLLVNVGERRKLLDSHVFLLFPVAPARRHEQLTEKKLRLQS